MKDVKTIMAELTAEIENGNAALIDGSEVVKPLFDNIGFPEDACDFLAEYYPETWVYAYDRNRFGTYDWATVCVLAYPSELKDIADDYSCTVDELYERGYIIEDGAFDGIIVLIND